MPANTARRTWFKNTVVIDRFATSTNEPAVFEDGIALSATIAVAGINVTDATLASDGDRAPIFVHANPAPEELAAGYNPGLQVIVAKSVQATPSATNAVAGTIYITNENGRDQIWGLNVLALMINPFGLNDSVDCKVLIAELEAANTGTFVDDPFAGGLTKIGLLMQGHGGGTERLTAAFCVTANDDTGDAWWNRGIVMRRVAAVGVHFRQWAGDEIDAFATAAILDDSNSATVLRIEGTHGRGLWLAGTYTGAGIDFRNGTVTTAVAFARGQGISWASATSDTSILESRSDANSLRLRLANADSGVGRLAIVRKSDLARLFEIDHGADIDNPIFVRVGGVLQKVTAAAADSGGTGFRNLVVPNAA